jgi:hypothetical protein
VPLPVAGEINRLATPHGELRNALHLSAIGDAAVVLTPCGFLRVANEVRAGDVMVMADRDAAHAAEKAFGLVGAGAVQAVRLLVIDALHLVAAVQVVPCAGLVGVNDRAFGDAAADE